ncbi:hypothetical protein M9458_009320, partial [Cirrhinus mrigala]
MLPNVSLRLPTLSTNQTPSRVNRKFVNAVTVTSQMANLSSRTPDICRMVAL